jgi:Tat protein secretion system quality control protein TatD with DNase activity
VPKRPKHPPIVYVEWTDSAHVATRWIDRKQVIKEARQDAVQLLVTAGFLLEDAKTHLTIALDVNPHLDDVAQVGVIPRSAIVLMEIIRPARKG